MKKQTAIEFLVKHLDHWPKRLGGAPVIDGYKWHRDNDNNLFLFPLSHNFEVSYSARITRKDWLNAQLNSAAFSKESCDYIVHRYYPHLITSSFDLMLEGAWSGLKNKKQKIYIAGPMATHPDSNRPAFNTAASWLSMKGYIVLNPAILPDGLSQKEYMQIDIAMLQCCDAIFMLKGWDDSAGAMAEHALAMKLGLEVIHEGDLCQE